MTTESADRITDLFNWYLANQASLVKVYNGRTIAIGEHGVLGAYSNRNEAWQETRKSQPVGTFIIQRVSPGPEAYTIAPPIFFLAHSASGGPLEENGQIRVVKEREGQTTYPLPADHERLWSRSKVSSGEAPRKPRGFSAIWDTGAPITAISTKVIDELELKPSGKIRTITTFATVEPDEEGRSQLPLYSIDLQIPDVGTFVNVHAMAYPNMPGNIHILLGLDIIRHGRFSVKWERDGWEVSFALHEQSNENQGTES